MTDLNAAACLKGLRSLSDKQFAEVFYQAAEGRELSNVPRGTSRFVLADAEFTDGELALDVIALPGDDSHWIEDLPICQSGECARCGLKLRSWAKQAECPLCRLEVACS
jgi:hypothetical protein